MWDVAQYDQFVSCPIKELNRRHHTYLDNLEDSSAKPRSRFTLTRRKSRESSVRSMKSFGDSQNEETIINEEVKISDFAYSKFLELRHLDGITDKDIQKSLGPQFNYKAVFKAGES